MNTLYMRFIVFGFLLFIYSCGNKKTEVTNENVVQKDSLVKIDLTNSENKIIYVPSNIKVLDTTLFSNRNFSKFKESIEALEDLNKITIDEYLFAAIVASSAVINSQLPKDFEIPAVKSRLRVVKTNLLKSRFYAQQEDMESLTKTLDEVFGSYNILLKRIDDLIVSEEENQENEFEVNKRIKPERKELLKN
ncbi:hypothetical protein N9M11_04270 [Flavobacteriaceae bacterium]|uniref:hypothetical protein n=1 Tax=Candidatus Arcticimaribacter forsetii TaxID=2820661 RepID=UPI002076F287|nr:hypothetical protein [Candidatus Arcticimaribacter forsetii]MDA8699310.1 hypothetical protein [Flavobacteriaceae bacterium]MDB2345535.1 hypothetical protein [Flavobacteriaceae bacterium]MDB4620473.1 hypothetical protein [Flavobacteriaceae bacterium]MDB4674168.1 hypothetical protein [Flavobacteriaceae bacterium]MDB4751521.1 hypothetical protein [Flavobacteriaceae bacterium]